MEKNPSNGSEIWKPLSTLQEHAYSCPWAEVGVGGARGGGKSEVGIAWLVKRGTIEHGDYRALVLRKDYDDLKDWIDRAQGFYKRLAIPPRYRDGDFIWPNGAQVRTGHYHLDKSFQKYVGHQYHRILIEELNLIPREENYLKLVGSLRSVNPDIPTQIMSNFNPSDQGFYWIRERFKLKGIPRDVVPQKDPTTGLRRVFIPLRLEDNPILANDKQYKSWLDALPDGLREAWRDGSWDDPQIEGGVYTSEILQAVREGRFKLKPINKLLPIHTVWDIGVGDATAIGFVQRTKTETSIVHYYENSGFGLPHYRAYLDEFQRKNQIRFGKHFAPFDIKVKEWGSGATRIQLAEKMGLKFEKVPSVPLQDGIEKARLMWPRLWVSEPECVQLISALKNYRKEYDEHLLQYKETPLHDWSSHGSDMIRYLSLVEEEMTDDVERPHYRQDPDRELPSPNFVGPRAWRSRSTVDEMGNPIGDQSAGRNREDYEGPSKYW